MTKSELEELAYQVFASYNQVLYDADKKVVLRAWFDILHDIPYDGGKRAFLDIAATSSFMPKPGDIRRAYIDRHTIMPKLLLPQIAWGILLRVVKEANSGSPTKVPMPEEVSRTIQLLGDSVWGYHTNGDRTEFYKVYETVLAEMQKQKYEIPEKETQAQEK